MDFRVCVSDKVVNGNDHGHAKGFDVFDMATQVWTTLFDRVNVFSAQIGLGHATVHFHRTHGCHNNNGRWGKARLAAFDVHEFFGPKVGAKARLGHYVIGNFQRGCCRHNRVTAMRDVRKWATMHKRGVVFQSLHKVWLHRVFQQHGHCAVCFDVAAIDRCFVTAIRHDDVAQTFLQVFQIGCKAQDCHNFGRNSNVKPCLTGEAVGNATERRHHVAQRAVVHVHHATPYNAAFVDFQFVAPVNVVVDHGGQQVVRGCDCMEIACEMQVHFLHRDNLGIPAARRAALHAETWAKGCLANTNGGFFANAVQTITQTDGCGGLSFARWRRVDRGHKDQFAVFVALDGIDEILADFGFVMAIRQKMFTGDAQLCTNLLDRFFVRFACDFDVRLIAHGLRPLWPDLGKFSECGISPSRHRQSRKSDISHARCGGMSRESFGSETQCVQSEIVFRPRTLIGNMQSHTIPDRQCTGSFDPCGHATPPHGSGFERLGRGFGYCTDDFGG